MFKRLLIAVAGYSAYRWWNKRGDARASRRGGRSFDPAE
jgi:hypothetical protein